MIITSLKVPEINETLQSVRKMSRVTSIDPSLFMVFPIPLLLSFLPFMTSHGSFFRTLCRVKIHENFILPQHISKISFRVCLFSLAIKFDEIA